MVHHVGYPFPRVWSLLILRLIRSMACRIALLSLRSMTGQLLGLSLCDHFNNSSLNAERIPFAVPSQFPLRDGLRVHKSSDLAYPVYADTHQC
jgi:hypothetical protein